MNIAICDDNNDDLETLCRFLMEYFENNGFIGNLKTFSSGEALLSSFAPGAFDAIFLDIYMDGMTGIKTAEKMRQADPNFALVFITSSENHAVNAFTLRANGYVTKPINKDSLNAALLQCRSVFLRNARFLEVKSNRQNIRIPMIKIYYIEVYNHDILVHTMDGTIKTSTPLDRIEIEAGKPFLRCHRSYLVNMNYVTDIVEQGVVMNNRTTVPLRKQGRAEIREVYADFISDRLFER